jgi:hypothetical protein
MDGRPADRLAPRDRGSWGARSASSMIATVEASVNLDFCIGTIDSGVLSHLIRGPEFSPRSMVSALFAAITRDAGRLSKY